MTYFHPNLITKMSERELDSNRIRVVDVNGYTHKRIYACIEFIIGLLKRLLCLFRMHLLRSCRYVDESKFIWEKVYITYGHGRGCMMFEVEITEDHRRYVYVIRPCKKYRKMEFEALFRFGGECDGYTESRQIALFK